ncbi:hypothetical protein IPA_03675 [Ignicoccus pacificus DSM 13166]|uniref:Uncharacterized protein n=1 Tax=Ignicoccus pacificus DSM 13166 TaxID=940294 RepID=A0A977KCP9_9CREN|nr:hypothetical protein IPA_03675 [Ignicoccus pacificus DSM 13166]
MYFDELVRERDTVLAVQKPIDRGNVKALTREGELVEGKMIIENWRLTKGEEELTLRLGDKRFKLIRRLGHDIIEWEGKRIIGRALFADRWTGSFLPFHDFEKGRLLMIRDEEEEVLLSDVGRILPCTSRRCGGVTSIAFFETSSSGTKLYRLDVEGRLRHVESWSVRVEGVTPSGTAYSCLTPEECVFIDCNGLSVRIKHSISLFSNATILNEEWVAFEVIKNDERSYTRLLLLNSEGDFDFLTPYAGIADPVVVDALNGIYMVHGVKKGMNGIYVFSQGYYDVVASFVSQSIMPEDAILAGDGKVFLLQNGKVREFEITA